MERNVTYLTEEELNRIVDEAITDTIGNALKGVKQSLKNRSDEFKQGWDTYKNAQKNGQNPIKGIKDGMNMANMANYKNRTYNADGTIKKPGFFNGTFTAIADNFTGGKWSKVRNGLTNINMQRAYANLDNKNQGMFGYSAVNKYDQRLFDFWVQNIKGKFENTEKETADQIAVRMWNEWYKDQTHTNRTNEYLNRYIADRVKANKPMSYMDFFEYCKSLANRNNNSHNGNINNAIGYQNRSLPEMLRKNLMQLI